MQRLFLGLTQADPESPKEWVYFEPKDRMLTSGIILGGPGSGKSKFQEWMIRGDIDHTIRDHCGPALIDFHGSLFADVERYCARTLRLLDRPKVYILNPSDGDFILGFNPFLPRKGLLPDVQVSGMVDALLAVWGQENTDQTPTLGRVLRLVFYAMHHKEIPIHDAHYLINFSDHELRREIIDALPDEAIRNAWRELQTIKNLRDWQAQVLSTENRLFRFIDSPIVRQFMGSTDPGRNIDLLDILNRGDILLVNLKPSGRLSRDNAHAFGALLLNELFRITTTERAVPPPNHYFVYIDEWQNAITRDIDYILAECRKFGIHLILGNQHVKQIPEEIFDTVLTCCQMKAVFGGLPYEHARMLVENMVAGQIDLNEEKYVLEQTKFWPKYGRDTVRVRGRVDGWSSGSGDVASSGSGWSSTGDYADGSSFFSSTGHASSGSSGVSHADVETDIDIPILMPEPFKEVSQRVTYTLEEQLFRWAARFKEQYQRHCFLKLPHHKTVPLGVPNVPEVSMLPDNLQSYRALAAHKTRGLPPAEVDGMLEAEHHARFSLEAKPVIEAPAKEKRKTERSKKKSTPFDDIIGRE